MKTLLFLGILAFSQLIMATEINLTGLSAKAVQDTLESENKLQVFADGGMGKRYLEIGAINCTKSTVQDHEFQACTFKSKYDETEVTLKSSTYNGSLDQIRSVLSLATLAETQTSDETKSLSIQSLKCVTSGIGHVLDTIKLEMNYSCTITL